MTRPLAPRVTDPNDPLGPACRDCGGDVYADKIERGPRIGVRITWRHVASRCNKLPGGVR